MIIRAGTHQERKHVPTIRPSSSSKTFAALSEGDDEALIRQLADPFTYEFVGTHALGGIRTTKASMRAWFERIHSLIDGLTFEPLHIEVGGPPWNTTVLTEVDVRGSVADAPYHNVLFQRIRLKNGKITEIRSLEDTQHLERVLNDAVARGVTEAAAAPISDDR